MTRKNKIAPNVGLEPTTLRLRVSCSTDWASRAGIFRQWKYFDTDRNLTEYFQTCGIIKHEMSTRSEYFQILFHCSISSNDVLGDFSSYAVVAEWLRRLTRNQFPSGSVGSNPTDCDNSFFPSPPTELSHQLGGGNTLLWCASIVGSVVECSPATRAARVRFPDDADNFLVVLQQVSYG